MPGKVRTGKPGDGFKIIMQVTVLSEISFLILQWDQMGARKPHLMAG